VTTSSVAYGLARAVYLAALIALSSGTGRAQERPVIVVDRTGLPLPGVTIQLLDRSGVTSTVTTGSDGTFVLDPLAAGDRIVASLDGFEAQTVSRVNLERIQLELARAVESTTVVGSVVETAAPTSALLGSAITASTVARLPSAHMNARESLPLLPAVTRGPDGLIQLGGARAYETPLTIDGFNVTDPATGYSSINLPLETVKGIEVLRDPISTMHGGLLGGLVRIESTAGSDDLETGIQGFVPRPRWTSPGFGRIEGIFPRAYVTGTAPGGRLKYVAAAEYDYERIPVPDVTDRTGDDLIEQSAIMFTRFDMQWSPRQRSTVESFAYPTHTRYSGLGPRREAAATVDLSGHDLFGGVTHRLLSVGRGVLTLQFGAFARHAELRPNGSDAAVLSPDGWSGNWFTQVQRASSRYTGAASWERVFGGSRSHDVTVAAEFAKRSLDGRVHERSVHVIDQTGRRVRSVEYGAASTFGATDRPFNAAVRDVWQASTRLQIDGGVRVDYSNRTGATPSTRVGTRLVLDSSGDTVLKAGYGGFVGNLPLGVPAFANYPDRIDRSFDPDTGDVIRELHLKPVVGRLRLPHAKALVLSLERRLARGLDAQVMLTRRRSSHLATLRVPTHSGAMSVESNGRGSYDELQLSARRAWGGQQQLFLSYTLGSSFGELNDFSTLFQSMDVPLVQPGGQARTASDARHRLLAWSTLNLPSRVVISPVMEWRSGFPYSAVDARYFYDGAPQSGSFPAFFAVDTVAYKTFTVKQRDTDLGIQIFNLTHHTNPRDVYPVVSAPRFGQFGNSIGTTVRGYMLLKW